MSHGPEKSPRKFVIVEFTETQALLDATTKVRVEGERARKNEAGAAPWGGSVGPLDTHTPFPVHGLSEALALPPSKVPWIVFGGAMTGAGGGFLMMTWMNHINYAINVGNRPTFSWPTQIPITFELGILLGGFGAFFGLMALMGLPQPYHPVFESENFRRASTQTYFLSIEIKAGGDAQAVADAVRAMGAATVDVIEESER